MKHNVLLSALIAFVLTFIQFVSPASAKTVNKPDGPDCRITASTTTPIVGEPVQLTVSTSLVGPVSVYFGDNTEVQNGRSLWHTFHYVGTPVAVASVWIGRSAIECTFDFTVSDGNGNGYGGGVDIPDYEFDDESGDLNVTSTVVEVPVMTVGDISADLNEMGENTGENSFGFVNSGNGDVTVTIERSPEPLATVIPTPSPDIDKCSENSAQGSEPQINICGNSGTVIINVNPVPVHNSTFWEIVGQAIANWINRQ